jgi:hypothetical protein
LSRTSLIDKAVNERQHPATPALRVLEGCSKQEMVPDEFVIEAKESSPPIRLRLMRVVVNQIALKRVREVVRISVEVLEDPLMKRRTHEK